MPLLFYKPAPAPAGVFEGLPLPAKAANPLSKFLLHWITPIVKVGHSRHIEADGEPCSTMNTES
jgi:hypothetical protein